ncbi:MAG: alpha-galactosidase [Sphingobacteriales bacterium]|nr:MAG: alpha-galactosidase [Sphingobacteriales bacterium]
MRKFKKSAFYSIVFTLVQLSAVLAQKLQTNIHADGSFDIVGSHVQIKNCYPALDNKHIKAIGVKISQKADVKFIEYQLLKQKLTLEFGYENQILYLKTQISQPKNISNKVSIIKYGQVVGANKVYKTPVIIGGKGGIFNWPDKSDKKLNCESITGLVPDSGATFVISTHDYKKYISTTSVLPTENFEGQKLVDVSINTEGVPATNIPVFYFSQNASAYDAMRSQAQAAANFMGAKNNKSQSYHWCSWYFTYYHLTQNMVTDFVKGFKSVSPAVNIQTFQIDAGYHPHLGDWLEPSTKFPNGLASSVKEIIANNYKAGIWIGPYMVGNRSKLYAQHPDWILRKTDGSPIIQMSFYGEERLWGAMDEETYVLDTSNPAVMDYLRNVFRTFKQMGITFFKTDFMYYGWEGSNNVKRFTPGKTSSEYQREFFDMIRQEIGSESYWLGCIAPFPVMLGYVDGMRVAGDISPKWEASVGMFEETEGDQHINNIWWQNDPDALILREKYSQLSLEETKTMAYWVAMLGGVINTSDLFHEIPSSRADLFRFIEPNNDTYTGRFPFIDKTKKINVITREYPSRKAFAILFANRTHELQKQTYTLQQLINLKNGYCFSWDVTQIQKLGNLDTINIELKPHHSKIIYISADNQSPEDINLGGKNLKAK